MAWMLSTGWMLCKNIGIYIFIEFMARPCIFLFTQPQPPQSLPELSGLMFVINVTKDVGFFE